MQLLELHGRRAQVLFNSPVFCLQGLHLACLGPMRRLKPLHQPPVRGLDGGSPTLERQRVCHAGLCCQVGHFVQGCLVAVLCLVLQLVIVGSGGGQHLAQRGNVGAEACRKGCLGPARNVVSACWRRSTYWLCCARMWLSCVCVRCSMACARWRKSCTRRCMSAWWAAAADASSSAAACRSSCRLCVAIAVDWRDTCDLAPPASAAPAGQTVVARWMAGGRGRHGALAGAVRAVAVSTWHAAALCGCTHSAAQNQRPVIRKHDGGWLVTNHSRTMMCIEQGVYWAVSTHRH